MCLLPFSPKGGHVNPARYLAFAYVASDDTIAAFRRYITEAAFSPVEFNATEEWCDMGWEFALYGWRVALYHKSTAQPELSYRVVLDIRKESCEVDWHFRHGLLFSFSLLSQTSSVSASDEAGVFSLWASGMVAEGRRQVSHWPMPYGTAAVLRSHSRGALSPVAARPFYQTVLEA